VRIDSFALRDVEEVRSLVTQHSNLCIVLAFDPVIALSGLSLLVLGFQQKVCHQASAEQEERQVCQHYSVTEVVLWLVLCSVVEVMLAMMNLVRGWMECRTYL
jgi:hypothetical protein